MASNEVAAINRALSKGDEIAAREAYARYYDSMTRAGQTPKPASYFGIKN